MISVTNVHEALARHEKALKLADLLDALHMTSAIASECSCLDWIRFAMLVEVNKPRQATQALVIEMLRGREAVRWALDLYSCPRSDNQLRRRCPSERKEGIIYVRSKNNG
jgi:hypothetical protein